MHRYHLYNHWDFSSPIENDFMIQYNNFVTKRMGIFSLIIVNLFCLNLMPENKTSSLDRIYKKLPHNLSVWKKSEQAKYYSQKNLSEYIDGNAELFISYNFKNLLTLSYKNEKENEITVDIFDMGNSRNAYGVFSNGREKEDGFISAEIGSEYGGGLLTFWKGRYYVSILAYPETKETKKTIREIAKNLVDNMKGENIKPELVRSLPKKNLAPYSIKYFYHYVWLNSYYFVSNENILNMGDKTSAVLARYYPEGRGKQAVILLLVKYQKNNDALEAEKKFRNFVKNSMVNKEKIQKLRAVILCKSNLLGIVFNARDKKQADEILTGIR